MSMSIWPHPFSIKTSPKMVLLSENRIKLDTQTHIYLESVSSGVRHKHIYMATPLSIFIKAKNGILPETRMEL